MGDVYSRFVTFAYDRPGQTLIFGALPTASLRDLSVVIENAFDDPATAISVGTLSAPSLILGPGNLISTVAGEYRVPETRVFVVREDIYLFLSPATSTRGGGRLYFMQTEQD